MGFEVWGLGLRVEGLGVKGIRVFGVEGQGFGVGVQGFGGWGRSLRLKGSGWDLG